MSVNQYTPTIQKIKRKLDFTIHFSDKRLDYQSISFPKFVKSKKKQEKICKKIDKQFTKAGFTIISGTKYIENGYNWRKFKIQVKHT